MLYLIQIHWTARDAAPGRPPAGTTETAEFARTLTAAINKAKRKFLRHYGTYRRITGSVEKPDPAGIFEGSAGVSPASSLPEPLTRHDCGSGLDYGICPQCGRGHGHVLMRDGKFL